MTLAGNTSALAQPQYDLGAVSDSFALDHLYLVLQRSPAQEAALQSVLADLQNPQSANYHQWLTAEQIGQYGPSQQDISAVVNWLSSHGIQVNGVSASGLTIDVSATAGQLREAFHTEMHTYNVNGQKHISNASDPQIPAAFSGVVAGFNSLNDFKPKPQLRKASPNFTFNCVGCPGGFNNTVQYDEAPADFATIYNVSPLYKGKNPLTGKGQKIVVFEDTDVQPADIATFRSAFGLSSYSGTFTQVHPGNACADPGLNSGEIEGAIDAEWAGALAPDADVELASCADTQTNYGFLIAAQNVVDQKKHPPIVSMSYGVCEALLGPSFNLFVANLWEQAALEGISVFVAAGDGGPALCDFNEENNYAVNGISANGIASTPFNMAVGGTDFLDTVENSNSAYWKKSNSASGESAKSYVPETTWNESCASSVLYTYFGYSNGLEFCNSSIGANFIDVSAGSGAPSIVYSKPYWQQDIFGNPKDGVRDLPDVALFSSAGFYSHAVLFCMSDAAQGGMPCDYSNPTDTLFNSGGGTSFAAPQLASVQALINQRAGAPQGNPAPIFYDLARFQYGTNFFPNIVGLFACNAALGDAVSPACSFHDVTVGNNNVPCYGTNNCYGGIGLSYGLLSTLDKKLNIAYPSQSGWDFATGLGSINVANIVNSWP